MTPNVTSAFVKAKKPPEWREHNELSTFSLPAPLPALYSSTLKRGDDPVTATLFASMAPRAGEEKRETSPYQQHYYGGP